MSRIDKTNAMRILDKLGLPYQTRAYPHQNEAQDAVTVAQLLDAEPDAVFKTLVVMDTERVNHVCVIPGPKELDLKLAAAAFSVKNLRMLHVDELKPLTGYVRGGCSPIGMKKPFTTLIDESALLHTQIYVSAGQIGSQLLLSPQDLAQAIGAKFVPLTR